MEKRFSLNKRQKIVIVSVILSIGLVSTQLVPFYLTYRFIAGLTILSAIFSLWVLWEELDKLKAVILLILPTFFTLAVASYYFLLPVRWLTRIPVAFLFGIVFYTLLLSQNVFNVAAMRAIPLYRVASTAVFILTLITAFLLFNVLFSMHLPFYWNGLAAFIISFPLVLHMIWSIEMEKLSALIMVYTSVISVVAAELAIGFSFWPVSNSMIALILSTGLYVTLGIGAHSFRDRLNKRVVWEYLGWGLLIFLLAIFTTSWAG